MTTTTALLTLVEREGWHEVLANLHNVAKGQGRNDIATGLSPLVDELVVTALADDHEEDCFEDDGEAAYGRDD